MPSDLMPQHFHTSTIFLGLLLILVSLFSHSSVAQTSGLIASYSFDEGSGTALTDSTGGNPGTLSGNPTWVAGKNGVAVNFDGAGDYASFGRIPATEGASQLTWAFWAYTNAFQNDDVFLSKGTISVSGSWLMGMTSGCNGNNQFYVLIPTATGDGNTYLCASSGSVAIGVWKHYAVVFDGTQTGNASRLKIYVNGSQDLSNDFGGVIPAQTIVSSDPVRIARNASGGGDYNGKIDDFQIYTRALTAAEISSIYSGGGSSPSPVPTPPPPPPPAGDTTAPTTPTGLSATAASQVQINLIWTASTDATGVAGYRIYRDGTQITTVTSGAMYQNIGLTAGTAYSYTVAAYDVAGNVSSQSTAVSVTTQSAVTPTPAPTPIPTPVGNVVAFPGAEGFGANSVGGRGGRVIKVTNLNDSGPGSFRAAVTASGPRIVVFDVSGIINLASSLTITQPYLTIAGQTSPGGILITGYQTTVQASHVVMQYMRFRVGSHRISSGANPEQLDSFDIWGSENFTDPNQALHDIIVDHSSFGWGVDECFSTAYNLDKVTISNSIIAEGLSQAGHPKGEHSKGMLVWAKYSPKLSISLYRNYFAHNKERNPLINTATGDLTVDVANNVAYNFYGGYAMGAEDPAAKINWRNNYSKGGLDSNAQYYEIFHEVSGTPVPNIYVIGNIGGSRLTQTGSDWTVASSWQFTLLNEAWRKLTPSAYPASSAQTMTYALAQSIVDQAGATKPFRDSADTKVVNDFKNNTGRIINNVKYPDDFPTYQNLLAPTDSDNDGMADSWESANGLNIGIDDSAQDKNANGYTNIEEYLYFLTSGAPPTPVPPPPPPAGDTTPPTIPTGLSATAASQTQVNLSWTASTDAVGVTGYRIYRGGTQLTTVTGTTYANTGLTSATTYAYTVAAYDAVGNVSNQTASVSATTQSAPTPPPPAGDTTPPLVTVTSPVNNATFPAGQTITINASSSDAVGVTRVDFFLDNVGIGSDAASPYTILWPSTVGDHSIMAQARDAAGNSAQASITIHATATSTNPAPQPPPATPNPPQAAPPPTPPASSGGGGGGGSPSFQPYPPSNFIAEGAPQQVVISWTNPTDSRFTAVRLYRDTVLLFEGNRSSFTDLGATPGKVHTYFILALYGHEVSSRVSDSAMLGERPLSDILANQHLSQLPVGGGLAPVIPTVLLPSISTTPVSGSLQHPLFLGMEGTDVTILQQFLVSQGLLSSTPTGYFGALTQAALQAYQKKEGIVSAGTPETTGYGLVGLATRARINAQLVGGTGMSVSKSTPTPAPVSTGKGVLITRLLYKGLKGSDVTLLQNYLITKKYLATGNNSGFFGAFTEQAVKLYQKANGLEPVGSVGPRTRQYLGDGR